MEQIRSVSASVEKLEECLMNFAMMPINWMEKAALMTVMEYCQDMCVQEETKTHKTLVVCYVETLSKSIHKSLVTIITIQHSLSLMGVIIYARSNQDGTA
jgi:hypothetical protein